MTHTSPPPEPHEVDPGLMRRVAWGLLAGRSKAQIATLEGISPALCLATVTAPGMMALLTAWANVLHHRCTGGRASMNGLAG